MKKIRFLMFAVAVGLSAAPVRAGTLIVSGTVSSAPDGADFSYTIKLSNSSSSTDSIETFWFSWVPGQNYLATMPLSETPPTGWTVGTISHGSSSDGFGIQFVTTSAALAPGNSLTFGFTSMDAPAAITGHSMFHSDPPVGTSTIYSGTPFRGDSALIVVGAVPEPSTLTLGLFGLGSFAAWRRRRAIARRRAVPSRSLDIIET
jgi:hypothetical protein